MSLWFLHQNHLRTQLDTLSVNAAMDQIDTILHAEGRYGHIGTTDETPEIVLHWRPGDHWRARLRALLTERAGNPRPGAAQETR